MVTILCLALLMSISINLFLVYVFVQSKTKSSLETNKTIQKVPEVQNSIKSASSMLELLGMKNQDEIRKNESITTRPYYEKIGLFGGRVKFKVER